jgi:coenzyme F420-0:L-glutamate ligase/coenzyme F420-1:gamma-L-glutamate ligase
VTPSALTVVALEGLPEVATDADLAALIAGAMAAQGLALQGGDIVVIAQKIVSKAEGRRVRFADVTPSARARELASTTGKDPRLMEIVLRESREVLRVGPEVIVVEDVRGLVLANAGVDQSNVGVAEEMAEALLLPVDPDASAERIRERLRERTGVAAGVIIADSLGRAWRLGTVGHAIGASGIASFVDLRGRVDRDGRPLRHSELGVADSLAAAALLVMGEADEGRPAALVRGWAAPSVAGASPARALPARSLQRSRDRDLFR